MKKAYFAAGCFWGVEHLFKKLSGVVATTVGYMGGHTQDPSYEEVCRGNTGHLETLEVEYHPEQLSYEALVKYFFEIHDFTQKNGQGPDLGEQYLSAIFYQNEEERALAEKLIHELEAMHYKVATTLRPVTTFYPAEDYHQDYYEQKGTTPYCHTYRKVFP